MTRRSGITLLEVLVTIFIMGIGMLSLLALFPLGAINMASALRDDRTTSAAVNASNLALALDIRNDSVVVNALSTNSSNAVYVDAYGIDGTLSYVGSGGGGKNGIPRCSLDTTKKPAASSISNRWFTFHDDLAFETNGIPVNAGTSSITLKRAGLFTWAYLLRKPRLGYGQAMDVAVVVYHSRPVQNVPQELYFTASGTAGESTVTLSYTGTAPPIRRGSWLLDTTQGTSGNYSAQFYRVVNAAEPSGGILTLDVEPPLKDTPTIMTAMENVADVFERGPGLQP